MSLTLAQFQAVMPRMLRNPHDAATYLPLLQAAMTEAAINTRLRVCAFLAQLAHESGQLKYWKELWGPTAVQLRYEGRKDLGNIHPGDGERYMGRGPIQLTGRTNYRAAGLALGLDLEGSPELVATPAVGFRVAAWYWTTHHLNALADAGNFDAITKSINGGFNGKAERDAFYHAALKAIPA